MNTKLLLQIKEKILAEPLQFQMHSFYKRRLDFDMFGTRYTVPHCGTAACIGGWAICIDKKLTPKAAFETETNLWKDATSILDITKHEADILFEMDNWPEQFQYNEETSPYRRAKLAADRIDYFIATNGK